MPHSVASYLGLHCLPMSQKWDARLIWVNDIGIFNRDKKKKNIDRDKGRLWGFGSIHHLGFCFLYKVMHFKASAISVAQSNQLGGGLQWLVSTYPFSLEWTKSAAA